MRMSGTKMRQCGAKMRQCGATIARNAPRAGESSIVRPQEAGSVVCWRGLWGARKTTLRHSTDPPGLHGVRFGQSRRNAPSGRYD